MRLPVDDEDPALPDILEVRLHHQGGVGAACQADDAAQVVDVVHDAHAQPHAPVGGLDDQRIREAAQRRVVVAGRPQRPVPTLTVGSGATGLPLRNSIVASLSRPMYAILGGIGR